MSNNLLKGTDKDYWHRYVPLYEEKLKAIKNCNNILEFGVFKGESIRWLNNLYPNAKIYGSDILDVQSEWPTANNIEYIHVDQGNLSSIKNLFQKINSELDLIIEDGSHQPKHQRNCLVESLKHISAGGMYILEDLHTSHPEYPNNKRSFRNAFNLFKKKSYNSINSLNLLLCFEHLIANQLEIDEKLLDDISVNSLFNREEIIFIFNKISKIEIYRRSLLPHNCYSCHSTEFDYHKLKCKCGVDIYSNSDSMTALISIK